MPFRRANGINRRSAWLCFFVAAISIASVADAQQLRHVLRHSKRAIVALQPFSLDEPRGNWAPPVQLAYYAPRAIPRAEPLPETDEDES